MVSKERILKLYQHVDDLTHDLLKKEEFWSKCHPCKNQGDCCVDSETVAKASEWVLIRETLSRLTANEMNLLRVRVHNKQQCVFRTEDKCLINSVRPIVCRAVPYFAFDQGEYLFFHYPKGSCKREEMAAARAPISSMDSTQKYFRIGLSDLSRKVYYLNGLKLRGHVTFQQLVDEEQRFVLDWLTEYFEDEARKGG